MNGPFVMTSPSRNSDSASPSSASAPKTRRAWSTPVLSRLGVDFTEKGVQPINNTQESPSGINNCGAYKGNATNSQCPLS